MNARTPDQILAAMSWEDKLAQLQIIWRPSLDEATELSLDPASAHCSGQATRRIPTPCSARPWAESAHGIPLLIGLDVVHGQFTIFPTPLAQAASFDPGVAETDARVLGGLRLAPRVSPGPSPMVDVSRDPRWGRVVEGFGEDAHVNAVFGAAKVRGDQGDEISHSPVRSLPASSTSWATEQPKPDATTTRPTSLGAASGRCTSSRSDGAWTPERRA